MDLYEISDRILHSHVPARSARSSSPGFPPLGRFDEHISDLPKFEAYLDKWAQDLPLSLQHGHVDLRSNSVAFAQALLLRLRCVSCAI